MLDLDPKGEDPGLGEAAAVPPFSTDDPANAGGFTEAPEYEATGDETGYPDPGLPADETASAELDAGDAAALDAGVDAGLDDAGTDNSASLTKDASDPQTDTDSGADGGSQDEPQADGGAP
jgi:hypothetical protein